MQALEKNLKIHFSFSPGDSVKQGSQFDAASGVELGQRSQVDRTPRSHLSKGAFILHFSFDAAFRAGGDSSGRLGLVEAARGRAATIRNRRSSPR